MSILLLIAATIPHRLVSSRVSVMRSWAMAVLPAGMSTLASPSSHTVPSRVRAGACGAGEGVP